MWKTENAGRTWFPISDEGIPIGSIGAIAVAPSNPNIVYVGTGEPDIRSQHSYGIGMFKSTDAGKTWTHIGLEATRQIGRVVVDPRESESRLRRGARPRLRRQSRARACIARPTAARPGRRYCSRRTIRTMWARSTWPSIPRIRACSTLRCGRRAVRRGRSTRPPICPAAGLYKSTDGGDTWKQLTGGLPTDDFVGQDRHRGFAQQSQSAVGGGGRSGRRRRARRAAAVAADRQPAPNRRRSLYFRRCRRHLEAGQLREPAVGPRLVFRAGQPWIPPIPTALTSSTPRPT